MQSYEVRDTASGNLLGSFGTEWEAGALLCELAAIPARSHSLALVWGDDDDEERGGDVASGSLLSEARYTSPNQGT